MTITKVIGKIESTTGDIQVIAIDGTVRAASVGDIIYEGEKIVSTDSTSSIEVKYVALSDVTSYQGVFTVLATGSVIANAEVSDSVLSESDVLALIESEADTSAGEEGTTESSGIIEDGLTAESNVQGFNRGENGALGNGITASLDVSHNDDQTPPVILSSNVAIFDEGDASLRAEGDVVLQVISNDTSAVTYSIAEGLDGALFSIDAQSGELKFIETPDFENPLDSDGDNEYNVQVVATDAIGNSTTQLISISINNVNDNAPTGNSAEGAILEDGNDGVSGQVIGEDADGNEVSFLLVDDVTKGELTFNEDGSFLFNPNDDFQNLGEGERTTVTFTYKTVEEGTQEGGESQLATVTITVTGSNDAPVAVLDSATSQENEILVVDVLANDKDVDATHELSLDSVDSNKGGVSIVDNKLTFDPGSDFDHLALGTSEEVVVSYSMSDEHGETSTSTATITVTGTNDAPVSSADNASTFENQSVVVNVLSNDTDIDDGASLSLDNAFISSGAGGVSIVNNNIAYDPAGFYDNLSIGETVNVVIDYVMSDEHGATSSSSLTLTIIGTNDAPIVGDLSGVQAEVIEGLNVFTGSFSVKDVDNAVHNYTITNVNVDEEYATEDFSVVLNEDNTYNVTGDFNPLAKGESTQVSFNYNVVDSDGLSSNVATITLIITGTNDGPIAIADGSYTGLEGEYYGSSTPISGLTSAQSIVENESVDATFIATVVDYDRGGGHLGMSNHLQNFLDHDANSLSSDPEDSSRGVITLEGDMHFEEGDYTFKVYSDDGYQILIDGEVAGQFTGNRGPSSNVNPSIFIEGGEHHVEIIYWDQGGAYALKVEYTLNESEYHILGTSSVIATNENDSATIDVLANDTDIDHGALFTLDSLDEQEVELFSIVDNKLVFTPSEVYDYLAVGETTQVSIEYTMSDEHYAESSAIATLTITGTNDQPIVTEVSVKPVTEVVDGENVNSFSGELHVSDLDDSDTHEFVIDGANESNDPITATVVDDSGVDLGISATVEMTDTIKGTFEIKGDFNALAEGESATVTFSYVAVDNNDMDTDADNEASRSEPKEVTVTIVGMNDTPQVVAIDMSDAGWNEDHSGVYSVNFLDNAYASDVDVTNDLDIATLGRVISADSGEPVVDWTQPDYGIVYNINSETGLFEIDPEQFNYLQEGDSLEFTLTFNVIDSSGAKAENSATFSVEGRQDGAVISLESYTNGVLSVPTEVEEGSDRSGFVFNQAGEVISMTTQTIDRADFTMIDEDSASLTMSGTLADFDKNSLYNDAFQVTLQEGESLDISIDNGNTFSVYNLDGTLADTDNYVAGEYVILVHTTPDGINGANVIFDLDITINGVADASEFVGTTDETGESPENYLILDDSGNALSSKPISIDREDFAIVDEDSIAHIIVGDLGSAQSGANYNDAFSFSLEDGEVAHFNFVENDNSEYALFIFDETERTWVSVDKANVEGDYIVRLESDSDTQGGSYQLQINIDVSEANYSDNEELKEDSVADASGKLRVEDADMNEEFFQDSAITTQYGAFTIDTNGNWTYSIDDANTEINILAEGTVITDTFTVFSKDGMDSHVISVSIEGTNDLPVILAVDKVDYLEEDGPRNWELLDTSITISDVEDVAGTQNGFQEVRIELTDMQTGDKIQVHKSTIEEGVLISNQADKDSVNDNGKTISVNGTTLIITSKDGTFLSDAEIENVLQSITISTNDRVDAENEPAREVTITLTDAEGGVSTPAVISVNVAGSNDTPLVYIKEVDSNKSLKTNPEVNEDSTTAIHDMMNINLSDRDALGMMQVTLSVENGSLDIDLGNLNPDKFEIIVHGDDSVSIIGTKGNLNNLLDGKDDSSVTYTPDANFYGSDPLTVAVSDLGDRGFGAQASSTVLSVGIDSVPDFLDWKGDESDSSKDSANADENDLAEDNISTTKSFKIDFGDDSEGAEVDFTNLIFAGPNTSGGLPIEVEISADGSSVEAFVMNGDVKELVFTLTSDNTTHEYTFEMFKPIDHVEGHTNLDDKISLRFEYTATDADGDSIDGKVVINVFDDEPVIESGAIETIADENVIDSGASSEINIFDFVEGQVDGVALSINSINASEESYGQVVVEGGKLIYSATEDSLNFNGTVEVNFSVVDGDGDTLEYSATYTINPNNDQPIVFEVTPDVVDTGAIALEGSTTTVDYWNFTHNGGDLTIDMLTEINSAGNVWNQNGTNGEGYNEIDGDGVQSALDVMIRVYEINPDGSRGALVAVNDDNNNFGEDGSLYNRDSYLSLEDLPAGNYQLVVGAWNLSPSEVESGENSIDNASWHYEGPYQISLQGEHGVQMGDKGVIFEADNGDTTFSGTLPDVYDVDSADTHVYSLVTESETITMSDVTGTPVTDFEITVNSDGSYSLIGDFNALGDGDKATVTFDYVADDQSGFDGSGVDENSVSTSATVTMIVIGTDDLPEISMSNVTYHNNLVENGSFEDPDVGGNFSTLSSEVGAWDIESGSVDLINGYWPASEGEQSLDMSGNSAGTISQSFSTTVGATYTVTFDMSANSDTNKPSVDLQVSASNESETFSYDASTNDSGDMKWTPMTFTFVATESTTTLTFESLENDAMGAALDNVHVNMNYNGSDFMVLEDGSLLIEGIAITDVDGIFDASGEYEVALDSDNGSVEPSVITGTTLESINSQLEQVTFTPNKDFNGSTSISISVTDGSAVLNGVVDIPHDRESIALDIIPVNDAPIANDDKIEPGAQAGVLVTHLYDSEGNDLLARIEDELYTTKDQFYFDHSSLGYTGYNYMGSDTSGGVNNPANNNWFAEHGINISDLRGGVIEFEDGSKGRIDAASNGVIRDTDKDGNPDYFESSYIYYKVYDAVESDAMSIDENGKTIIMDVLANDIDIDSDLNITEVNNSSGEGSVAIVNNMVSFNPGSDFDYLKAGETTSIVINYVISDGELEDSAEVTIIVTGTNDAPIAVMESITKITDHISVNAEGEESVSEDFENGAEGWNNNSVTQTDGAATDFLGQFSGADGLVSKTFNVGAEHAGETVVIQFDMYEIDSWDNENFQVFINGELVRNDQMAHYNKAVDTTDGGEELIGNIGSSGRYWLDHDEVHYYSIEAVVSEDGSVTLGFNSTLNQNANDESWGIDNLSIIGGETWTNRVDTILPFFITQNMLLANDTDLEGDVLHVELVGNTLYGSDGVTIIGSVVVDAEGDIFVTPDVGLTVTEDVDSLAMFTYVVVDEYGAKSSEVTASIDVAFGTVVGTEVVYTQQSDDEIIIGTGDEVDTPANTEVLTTDNVIVVEEGGSINLSNIANIETIELEDDATVNGLEGINAEDVLDASDDGILVIESSDNDASDQATVDTDSLPATTDPDTGIYSNGDATLIIDIEPIIDTTL